MARYTVTAALSAPVVLDTGAVRVEGLIPSGVQRYGDVAEYVPPEELQAPEYVDGIAGLPVLYADGAHPGTADGLVTIDDLGGARKVGTILGQRWSDEAGGQALSIVLDDPDAEAIARANPYLSVGYRASRVARSGTAPDGTPYTAVQARRRAPNHVVLTRAPRAGYGAAVRLDAEDDDITPATPVGDSMDPAEMPPWAKALADAIAALRADVAALKSEESAEAAAEGEVMANSGTPRMDTIGDVVALQAAASDLGVALDPKATLADARKAVGAAMAAKAPGIRLDTDDDAVRAIATWCAQRPSQAERIARDTRLDTRDQGQPGRVTLTQ